MEKQRVTRTASAAAQRVPGQLESASMCICTQCSVQTPSACSKEKLEKAKAILEKSGPIPKGTEIPKLYCSTGKSSCKDLDTSRACICGSCPVFDKFNLASGTPTLYYCLEGKAR